MLVVVMSASHFAIAFQSDREPQQLTLREFLEGKAGGNRYVRITDFKLCDRYVSRKFKHDQRYWVSFIGIVPADRSSDDPAPPQLIVRPKYANEIGYLAEQWAKQKSLTGVFENSDREADWEQRQIAETYPGIALNECVILGEGVQPMSPNAARGWAVAGAAALIAGGLLLSPATAARFWNKIRGKSGHAGRPSTANH
jgi:hypothetical protein